VSIQNGGCRSVRSQTKIDGNGRRAGLFSRSVAVTGRFPERHLTPQSAAFKTKPSTPNIAMTKPKTRATARAEELRERLDDDTQDADDDMVLRAQVEFWSRLRTAFSANDSSTGLEALDDLAMAALADDTAAPLALTGTAVLLPSPDSMSAQDPPTHALFAPETSPARSKRPNSRGKGKARAPPSKKRRTVAKSRHSWFQLPNNAPKRIKDDLARLEKVAADQDTTPERLAYPWRDQRSWYDPDENPDLHLMHWRFVMHHRATFLVLAVYAPTDDSSARRKQKTLACQARLLFISRNIEEFGYYGFLDLFENSAHDHLMWLGGKAAKNSLDAKKAKNKDDASDPPQEDLAKLLRHDPGHYERVIERVLDPDTVDEEGYTSIPELLTQSKALDPKRPAHLRLSTHALARIVLDVTDIGAPLNPNWVGNRSAGPWKKLFSDVTILAAVPKLRVRLYKGRYTVKYDHKDFVRSEQRDDDSDFEDDGQPTIKPLLR
jgi:hypothetical protein